MEKIVVADYLAVPEGEFIFGSCEADNDAEPEEWPQSRLNIPAFTIKRTVISVGEWRVFLADSQYAWDEWENVAVTSPTDDYPIVFVNWYDAKAYCAWGSNILSRCMRLPNEFEWEKACRGNNGQIYPTLVNDTYDEKVYSWDEELETGLFINRPVGRNPARQTPYGCLDVWESVSEWCENWYEEYLGEKISQYNGDIKVLLANSEGKFKSFRGGMYYDGSPRCAKRGFNYPSFRNFHLGFRPVIE